MILFARRDVDAEIKRALGVWSDITDLTFEQRTSGKVHIEIRCVIIRPSVVCQFAESVILK